MGRSRKKINIKKNTILVKDKWIITCSKGGMRKYQFIQTSNPTFLESIGDVTCLIFASETCLKLEC